MKHLATLTLIFSLTLAVLATPSGSAEKTEHGNKDIPEDENGPGSASTQSPDSGTENWDQSKDDSQSLFLNKSDKNDLEPYPMALSDDAYDGQPIKAGEQISQHHAESNRGKLEHLIMKPEFYGEPPSMSREAVRRKRAGGLSLRSTPENSIERVNKMGSRYSAINRIKREGHGISPKDALFYLWLEQQQRQNDEQPYNEDDDSIYDNLGGSYNGDMDIENSRWYNEPVIPSNHISHQNYPIKPIFGIQNGRKYNKNDYSENPSPYLQNLEALYPYSQDKFYSNDLDGMRRKRQWAGLGNRVSKRFMVAKKRSEINPYFFTSQNAYKPYDDLYALNELLKSSQRGNKGYPVTRRMVL